MKLVWIDFDNSPHVLFFRPIIAALENRGYRTLLSARDAYNVFELIERFDLQCHRIGRHYGKYLIMKGMGTMIRAAQLNRFVRRHRPDLAVSHGSRSQVLICNILHVPSLLINDYEHAGRLRIPLFRPTVNMCPDVIPIPDYREGVDWRRKYPGIKEDVYIRGFEPDPAIYEEIGLDRDDLIVTVRPPATSAHYHVQTSDYVFSEAMDFLLEHLSVTIVLLPRTSEQADACRHIWQEAFKSGRIVIPDRAVDGINLIWHSDFVVSGGGTMNREAATLGVPVYSVFQGKIGAVDQFLSNGGRLKFIRRVEDVRAAITVERRRKDCQPPRCGSGALSAILDQIERMVRNDLP